MNGKYKDSTKVDFEFDIDIRLREQLNKIIHIQNIIIDLVGSWLWISGNTYVVRKYLKENNFKYAHKKKNWYWHGTPYRKYNNKEYTLEEIKKMFKTQRINNKKTNQLQ